MLLCFKAVFDLKVSLSKSVVILVDNVTNVTELASILGYRVFTLPMTYLRLPLGASFKCVHIWVEILEKMEIQLVGWKRMYLSKVGYIILIKSMLSSLHTPFLSLFTLMKVASRMKKLQRDFFMGSDSEVHKFHLPP